MKKRQPRKKRAQPSAPFFLVTFSDLAILLLTFFILLLSMATLDKIKIVQSLGTLRDSLGVLNLGRQTEVSPVPVVVTAQIQEVEQIQMEEVINAIQAMVQVTGLEDSVEVDSQQDTEGIKVTLAEEILFDRGRAEIKPAAFPILDQLAAIIHQSKRKVRIEGHTDNVQVPASRYPTNWELSTARSVNVVKYFVQARNLDPRIFVAAGYGEFSPVVPNITESNRAKNRRVEIYFEGLDEESQELQRLREMLTP
ncbi:OmpA/MotB domain protein [Desulfurispirillum indicum S5]|uniref:OmpA/MotB domain protein n=1 Tax=Desulfurispirillum indicum (strain ATCC BAA-1389 / DSM 22839 / S5) TaxID=653733 RepID=E6W673_DESIS|nr:OmpA family protein [Desulfurispirillum indicum]ADU66109.1 OmpA/MotB domain protein [Desulfurispirillum indicum S5]